MLKKIQKIVFKYLKNMKTCAPTGATVIGCKCYWVQLVLGATVFHQYNRTKEISFLLYPPDIIHSALWVILILE